MAGDSLRARLERLFEGVREASAVAGGPSAWSPLADVVETAGGFAVLLDLPGIDPAAVDVRVDRRRVTIQGHRPYPARAPQQLVRLECHHGEFARVVELPRAVSDTVTRRYEQGVLILELHHA